MSLNLPFHYFFLAFYRLTFILVLGFNLIKKFILINIIVI